MYKMNDNKSCNELSLRRDSFSDRFCDDLCSVVVSYLSFEDKIRFECISHQFQRLLFNKQYVIRVSNLTRLLTQNSLNQLLVEIEKKNHYKGIEIDLKAFKSVLKKCKFINKIVFDIHCIESENREKVLQLIAKYVKHLKSIEFDFRDINQKVMLEFVEKCGQKLENIKTITFPNFDYKPFMKLCPNIRSLTNIRLFDIIENNDLLVPKLMSVKLERVESDIHLLKPFVNKTQNLLKCLRIKLNVCTDKNVVSFMNLEELHLNIESNTNTKSLEVFFNNIGIKCKKINRLYVSLPMDAIQSINAQNYDLFKTFSQLKHLSLDFCNDLTLKSLKNCKQLTHLCLELSDDTFTDIDLYLPQLTLLCCEITRDISEDELKALTKLQHLKCLIINIKDYLFLSSVDKKIREIVNNCPEMRSIRFRENPGITDTTIDALISLAEKKPFCHFVHSFGPKLDYEDDYEDYDYRYFDFLEIMKNKKYANLPKNLDIIPFDERIFSIYGTNNN